MADSGDMALKTLNTLSGKQTAGAMKAINSSRSVILTRITSVVA